MKTLTKIEKVKRWLESGKSLTQLQASAHFNYWRLADAIHKLRKSGMWIINIGTGNYAKYIKLDKGPITGRLFWGYKLEVIGAAYFGNDLSEMGLRLIANNGTSKKIIYIDTKTLRNKEALKKAIRESEKMIV